MPPRNIDLHPQNHHPRELSSYHFDVIIIGTGPVGLTSGYRLASAGLSVACITDELYGGDCPFFACVPSKALLRPAEALNAAKAVGGAREAIESHDIDVDAVFKRRDTILQNWDDTFLLDISANGGVTPVRGYARLAGVKQVSVQPHGESEKFFLFAKFAVIIATGSTHAVPDIPGLDQLKEGEEYWTNREATTGNTVPEHLIILGGGAVGTEMATFYSRVGSKVTLITKSAEILPRVELEAARMVRKSLEESGTSIRVALEVKHIEKQGPNNMNVNLSNGETISGSVILNAIGRKPRTYDIGLETIGLQGNGSPLAVNSSMVVNMPEFVEGNSPSEPWLYCVGDTNGLAPTTHMGIYQCRIATNSILQSIQQHHPTISITTPRGFNNTEAKSWAPGTYPQTIFTDPSIATVGHTLASAKAAGLSVFAIDNNFAFPGAGLYGDLPGWARWVIEERTEKILGATICSLEASDLLGSVSVAVTHGLSLKDMVHVVPPFPTRGEFWREMLNTAGY
ncbi:hypothetical protein BDV96DRAFT_148508 [Lophiotrema nucula]|uniref:FAD/NAD(P)-binding domain-containing protein n=1 Tax=Lophiotrema nucula TaxID=690887 RepID=A0A6A5Z0S5_9PLEO|nr:hypothetical protein BDV96DRAFT_148508 [Lophiotrema nucula]